MMDLLLDFEQKTVRGNAVRFVKLELPSMPEVAASEGYFFEFAGQSRLPEPRVLDGFMLCFLLFAMQYARRYIVRGPLSARCMRNSRILQEAWHNWLPDTFRIVEIIPDTIIHEREFAAPQTSRAIAAFSGGVDATFLALRHGRRELGPSSYNLDTVVSVHGFDVPIGDQAVFSGILRRTDPLLAELGLERRVIRTNVRSPGLQHWEAAFGAHIACALHQFSHEFDYGLIGSGSPYDSMITPWGSTPATDYLLSGDDLEIVHEGAGYSRTEKIRHLATSPAATSGLNVCWEGLTSSGNCGSCEKCIRTRLNFLAAGIAEPDCFKGALDLNAVRTMRLTRPALKELHRISEYARRNGVEAPWLDAVMEKIRSADPPG
ncbi:hypothetical protein [Aestuariivirga sp.]|jgi:hypothetical protein|uniref:hypothetical protein n=1 Tax=Aestuariivirga sp. TaxID=2650926 RepID=UPI003784C5F3